ncbi:MAG: hypothetical protein AAFU63_09455 [Pseudomonadota bacterium]
MPDDTLPAAPARAGTLGFALGGAALLVVLVTFVAGPFAPQHSVGVSLGEIAAEAGKATLRNWIGVEQPTPQAAPWTIDRVLWVLGITLGIAGILCGGAAFVRREPRSIAAWATGLGIAAITVQFLTSALMIILGVIVVCALIYTLGDVLSIE